MKFAQRKRERERGRKTSRYGLRYYATISVLATRWKSERRRKNVYERRRVGKRERREHVSVPEGADGEGGTESVHSSGVC